MTVVPRVLMLADAWIVGLARVATIKVVIACPLDEP